MSFEEYSKWWAGAKKELDALIADEQKYEKLLSKFKTDRNIISYLLSGIYAKYSILVQKIGLIYDQMIQPQKREIVRKLLDVAEIRLSELNDQLRSVDISEFHYLDRNLIEFKLIPQEIEILDPFFYYLRDHKLEDLWRRIKEGEKIYVPPPPPQTEESQTLVIEEVEEETPKPRPQKRKFAVERQEQEQDKNVVFAMILQRNERGRQARLYYNDRRRIAYLKQQFLPNEDNEKAATAIQSTWRGFTVRQMLKRREKERRLLIGMTMPSYRPQHEFRKIEASYKRRQDLRDARIKEYIETDLQERERIFRVRGPGLMEDISDEIRDWFRLFYDKTKNFHPIPPEKEGGTILVVRGETLTPEQWMQQQQKKKEKPKKKNEKSKADLKKEKMKKLKQELAKKKKEQKRRKKLIAKGQFELELIPTAIDELYKDGDKEYRHMWSEKKDEDNPKENIYLDIIQEAKYHELQLEMRPIVDELMQIELELLLKALAKDNKKKYKAKKRKKKKKKGKKKKKDIFDKRSIEDLLQELVDAGIVHPYERAALKDFRGDLSYKNWDLRLQDFDPPTTLGDLKQVIQLNCILPLNVTTMKRPRSVLICGLPRSGKHLLANAVFTETRCILFDLSPEVLAGKYQSKKELKNLIQLVSKMSKLLQPSIIFVDRVERVFYKKVPAAEKPLEPKRLAKQLFKGLVKPIKPEDRVIILGVTGRPWVAKVKQLIKTFERIIPIPRPDYNSVFLFLTELLMGYHGLDRNFNISSLATMLVNYQLPTIKEVIESVLIPKRMISLSYNPLKQHELLEKFLDEPTINDKEYRKFVQFYSKTPVGKDRKVLNRFLDKKREDMKKMAERQK